MTPKFSPSPHDEQEMRLTAHLLGELTPEEATALEAELKQDPTLAALHQRLRKAMEVLRETLALPDEPAPSTPVQLSAERRARLLAHFSTPTASLTPSPSSASKIVSLRPRRDWSWVWPTAIAACVVLGFGATMWLNVERRRAIVFASGISDPRAESAKEYPILKQLRPLSAFGSAEGESRGYKVNSPRAYAAVPPPPPPNVFLGGGTTGVSKPLAVEGFPFVPPASADGELLDQARFQMTAQSRSPELNLYGQPHVENWPVYLPNIVPAATAQTPGSQRYIIDEPPTSSTKPRLPVFYDPAGNAPATIAGANTYTGATTISGGSVAAVRQGNAVILPDNSSTLSLASGAVTINKPQPTGNTIHPHKTFIIDEPPQTKSGNGTLTLSGANTFAGAVTTAPPVTLSTTVPNQGTAAAWGTAGNTMAGTITFGDASSSTASNQAPGKISVTGGTEVTVNSGIMANGAGSFDTGVGGSVPLQPMATSGKGNITFGGTSGSIAQGGQQAQDQVPILGDVPVLGRLSGANGGAGNATVSGVISGSGVVTQNSTPQQLDTFGSWTDTHSSMARAAGNSPTINGGGSLTLNGGTLTIVSGGTLAAGNGTATSNVNGVRIDYGTPLVQPVRKEPDLQLGIVTDKAPLIAGNAIDALQFPNPAKPAAKDSAMIDPDKDGFHNEDEFRAGADPIRLGKDVPRQQLQLAQRGREAQMEIANTVEVDPTKQRLAEVPTDDGKDLAVRKAAPAPLPAEPAASAAPAKESAAAPSSERELLEAKLAAVESMPANRPSMPAKEKVRTPDPNEIENLKKRVLDAAERLKAQPNDKLAADRLKLEKDKLSSLESMAEESRSDDIKEKDSRAEEMERVTALRRQAALAATAAPAAPADPQSENLAKLKFNWQAGQAAVVGTAAPAAPAPQMEQAEAPAPVIRGIAQRESTVRQRRDPAPVAQAGDAAMKARDYEKAAAYYKYAVDITPDSPEAKAKHDEAVKNFSTASVELAKQQITEGRFADAENTLHQSLDDRYDPSNKKAVTLLSQLEQPDYFNKTIGPKFRATTEQVKQWFTEAEGFYDTGRLSLAKKRADQILNVDPYNRAAREFQEKVDRAEADHGVAAYNETRAKQVADVDLAWAMPVRKFNIETGKTVPSVEEEQQLRQKASELERQVKLVRQLRPDQLQDSLKTFDLGDPTISRTLPLYQDAIAEKARLSNQNSKANRAKITALDSQIAGYHNILEAQLGVVRSAMNDKLKAAKDELLRIDEQTTDSRSTAQIDHKLDSIIIPKVELRDATLPEALAYLKKKSVELDTDSPAGQRGVNLVLKDGTGSAGDGIPGVAQPATATAAPAPGPGAAGKDSPDAPRITVSLTNIPLIEALKYVTGLANEKFKVEPYAVAVMPLTEPDDVLVTKEWEVPENLVPDSPAKDEPSGSKVNREAARKWLADNGVVFNGQASAIYIPRSHRIIVRNTQDQLDLIDTVISQKEEELEKAAKAAATPPSVVFQPEIQTVSNAFSTFSLNVADVSFKLAKASLEQNKLPDPTTIRSEEFINAFDYRDPEAAPGAPLAFNTERARDPFAQNRDLLRFAVKTAAAGRAQGHPLNVVLLLDKSGSMERADRVNIVREALRVLTAQLQPQDKLSIVTFARTPRLWADGVAGDKAADLVARVSEITPEGGTNLETALDLAYETAHRHYDTGSINRVVMFTDGAANLGDVNPDVLKKKVDAQRKQGVALDCFGIGWEGYNDDLLEQLTRDGDGRYGFINTPGDATAGFATQLAGALQVAAADVKVQVQFNPKRVTTWRQIGYAKHQLTKEQFRDNSVAAASIGAAESGNALYAIEVNPTGEGELATVRVRYRVPGTEDFHEREWTVPYTGTVPSLEQASPALRLAGVAAAFSEKLAASPYAGDVQPAQLLNLLQGVPDTYGADPRPHDLEWMIRTYRSVSNH